MDTTKPFESQLLELENAIASLDEQVLKELVGQNEEEIYANGVKVSKIIYPWVTVCLSGLLLTRKSKFAVYQNFGRY